MLKRRGPSSFVRGLLPLAVLLAAAPAGAYCRTRTCEFNRKMPCSTDSDLCSVEGPFVFWPESCVPFAVQRDGSMSDDIPVTALEALVEDAFRVWSEVSCPGGGTPELAAASQGPIACDAVEYDCKDPSANSNLIMFRDDFVDGVDSGLALGTIALTTLTANLRTGELFDADMEINTRDEDFVLDGVSGGTSGAMSDLRGVVNHEIGHLLGLSHTLAPGALMIRSYEGTTSPQADDVEGICAALGASDSDPVCDATPLGEDAECLGHDVGCTSSRSEAVAERGCACDLAGPGAPGSPRWEGLGWAAGVLLFQQLRRSRRGRSVV